jgi:alkanesulfonate monooxygenase SsuD/methylene tetrahydromethanopterin reductase-like flavin-dependent oxidoreductase (luciferase family)
MFLPKWDAPFAPITLLRRLAAQNGIAYSHSLLHTGAQDNPNIFQEYRKTFQPRLLSSPKLNIAVAGICADTEDQAYKLLKQHTNSFVIPNVVGTAKQCKEKLLAIQERFDVNEIIFLDLCHELEDRLRSYELLASELNLGDYLHDSDKSNKSNPDEKNLKLVSSGSTHN